MSYFGTEDATDWRRDFNPMLMRIGQNGEEMGAPLWSQSWMNLSARHLLENETHFYVAMKSFATQIFKFESI